MPIILANNFPPDHGGIQRYMERIAVELSVAGHEVRVVAPEGKGSAAFDRLQPYRIYRYRTGNRLFEFASMYVAYCRAIVGFPRTFTLASIWFPSGLAAVCVPRLFVGRVGIVAHGSEIAPSRRGLRRTIMIKVYACADRVFSNSSFTMRLLSRVGVRNNVTTVPCGVDSAEMPLRSDVNETLTILSVGRLVRRKGFDTVLRALPAVRARFPNVRYEIVGDGPYRGALEELASSLELTDCVFFLGSVDAKALNDAYGRAACFALPVRSDGDDVEGFGIVYLEAAIAGLGVIGGRDSGAEDAIAANETGFVVDGEDAGEVANALIELLGDPVKARLFGERGRVRALNQFRWSETCKSIVDALQMPIA